MKSIKFLHTVLFWLKNPEKDSKTFENCLQSFIENSKYVDSSFYGASPKAERDIIDDSFTFKLAVGFTSKDRHDAYQVENAHIDFIEEASPYWEKVQIYDSIRD